MNGTTARLREDARAIWQAGVEAVRSDRLVKQHVHVDNGYLLIDDWAVRLNSDTRIVVVGGGKAGAGMVAGLEEVLATASGSLEVQGWVNVPADCVQPTRWITLHAARPAGRNEPTEAGVAGVRQILRLLDSLRPDDICLCLLSGGGSALLPAPVPGITLADKQHVTRFLSSAGANIRELNTVRKQLSQIKGGGLARACKARELWTLIISDVLGDPLDIIASGPTVVETHRSGATPAGIAATPADATGAGPFDPSAAAEALAILERLDYAAVQGSDAVLEYLRRQASAAPAAPLSGQTTASGASVHNLVIGNNATAVDAAGQEAERRGYSHAMHAASQLEGAAEEVGRHLAEMALLMRNEPGPDCLITGGEPTVQLAPEAQRGKGGRNQQLALAALQELVVRQDNASEAVDGIALLSGGTDGEDGPTDAAGAWIDADVWHAARRQGLRPEDFLSCNDAYHFFQRSGGLLNTGPTHTNVCDVRVVTVNRRA